MKREPTIIAIGGGEMGRPGTKRETLLIDKEIVRLAGKKKPTLLFLPTASGDHAGYAALVEKYYGGLGCAVETLRLIGTTLPKERIAAKILGADIVYVGGGNTLKMMKLWRTLGVDRMLKQAHASGTVMAGLSAGSVCWFRDGNSDSWKSVNPKAPYIKVRGLGILPALHCPHYDTVKERVASLKKMMRSTPGVAIALENCTALEVVGSACRVLRSKKTANAYKVFWSRGKYHQIRLEPSEEFMPLKLLLSRSAPR